MAQLAGRPRRAGMGYNSPIVAETIPRGVAERFTVLALVGSGGYGRIYRARQEALDREVVLKVLSPHVLTNARAVDRFVQEARVTSRLNHPHIVTVLDFGLDDGRPWIAYELIAGGSLRSLIAGGRPDPPLAALVGFQVLQALEAAHDAGVLHRDLKPSNVMRDRERFFKVIDFGTARSIHHESLRTEAGTLLGTPTHMPPERIRGDEEDGRSDLYSLGVMLYHTATGRLPFDSPSSAAILYAHLHRQPEDPGILAPGLPPELGAFLLSLLEKHPEHRPGSAAEALETLRAIAARHPLLAMESGAAVLPVSALGRPVRSAVAPSPSPPGVGARRRRHRLRPVLLLLLASLPAGMAIGRLGQRLRPGPGAGTGSGTVPATSGAAGIVPPAPGSPGSAPDRRSTSFRAALADLEVRLREQYPLRVRMSGLHQLELGEFRELFRSAVARAMETSRRAEALARDLEQEPVAGGPERRWSLLCAAGHRFAAWAHLRRLDEGYRDYRGFHLEAFARYTPDPEGAARELAGLYRDSSLEAWSRGTSPAWGGLLFSRFREILVEILGAPDPLDSSRRWIREIAFVIRIVSWCQIELGWTGGRDRDQPDPTPPDPGAARPDPGPPVGAATLEIAGRLADRLRRARGPDRAIAAFLVELWKLAAAQRHLEGLDDQIARCREAITALGRELDLEEPLAASLSRLVDEAL